MNIKWQIGRSENRLRILKKQTGSMSSALLQTIRFSEVKRIVIGFSEDLQTMYLKKSDILGVKLSTDRNKPSQYSGRSFSARGLVNQFGEDIIGDYILEDFNEDLVILKRR